MVYEVSISLTYISYMGIRTVRKDSAVQAALMLDLVTLCLVPLHRERRSRAECWQLNKKWTTLHIAHMALCGGR
jgi:hypothetical protein